jgi:two-component system sensor histidine kinase BaeS
MRLRLVHQLSLLLAGIALFSAAAMGGWFAWNLRTGFSDYLRSRDAQQLARFAEVVAQRVDWSRIRDTGRRLPMRELMDEFLQRDGLPPPPPRRDALPPPRRPPGDVPQRIQVVDAQGVRLGGPDFPSGRAWIEQPVHAQGQVVAYVRMLPSAELQEVDARFLQRQYAGLAVALAVTLALGLAVAMGAARWLGAPLRSVQAATRRIAGGELGVTVAEAGSREMADLIQDVNRMSGALQQLEGARRRWIAQISHELRTPLSVLLGELEAIQDGVRAATPEMVGTLRSEVLQLVRLVNDLHTLSMADLGALPCVFADGQAGPLLRRVAERFEPRLRGAGLTLELVAGPDPLAHWDAGRIEQLLTNLLENCARHARAPGRVRVHWALDGAALVLTVEDSGPGVAPADLPQLFEPLFRADIARTRQAGTAGSGLGLAICRAIVQAHGGTIAASASALGGLRILARLPLQPEAAR